MDNNDGEIIGYDDSSDADELRVYCADCAEYCSAGAPPLRAGEEWGGFWYPRCEHCGAVLDQLELV